MKNLPSLAALIILIASSPFSIAQWNASLYSGYMPGVPLETTSEIEFESDGDIWSVNFAQLVHFDGNNWTVFDASNTTVPMSPQNKLVSIGSDLWIGTPGYGLYRMDFTGNATQYNTSNSGLLSDSIVDLEKNSQDELVIKTTNGLMMFDGNLTWTDIDISSLDPSILISVDNNDHIWFTQPEGPAEYDGISWTVHDTVGNCPNTSDFLISSGAIGTAFCDGQEITYFDGTSWNVYPALSVNWITSILADSNGDFWANSTDNSFPEQASLHYHDGSNWTDVNAATVLYEMEFWARCLTESPLGTFWSVLNRDLIEVHQGATIGIDDTSDITLTIYPNPANDELFISSTNGIVTSVMLIDALGKTWISEVHDSGILSLNVSDVPSGIYFIKTGNNQGKANITKLIIDHH